MEKGEGSRRSSRLMSQKVSANHPHGHLVPCPYAANILGALDRPPWATHTEFLFTLSSQTQWQQPSALDRPPWATLQASSSHSLHRLNGSNPQRLPQVAASISAQCTDNQRCLERILGKHRERETANASLNSLQSTLYNILKLTGEGFKILFSKIYCQHHSVVSDFYFL